MKLLDILKLIKILLAGVHILHHCYHKNNTATHFLSRANFHRRTEDVHHPTEDIHRQRPISSVERQTSSVWQPIASV